MPATEKLLTVTLKKHLLRACPSSVSIVSVDPYLKHIMEISFLRFLALVMLMFLPAWAQSEVFGPPNLLRTTITPFSPPVKNAPSYASTSLSQRLIPARVYFPSRMLLGKSSEFVVKGQPGKYVAIAMADKDNGASPIYGHPLRLGADRKLVTLGVIPEIGILPLFIETPIQGDLIGQYLYFEVAIWSSPDFSDLEIATPVQSETTGKVNGVLVSAETEPQRGIRFVPNPSIPLHQKDIL